ncbi:hypothetical protein WG66_000498, partial [Moniliophthora roreri]
SLTRNSIAGEHTLLVRNLVEQGFLLIVAQVRPNGSKLAILPPSDTLNATSSCPMLAQPCSLVSLSPFTITTATIMAAGPTTRPSRS